MKDSIYTVAEKRFLTKDVFLLKLSGDTGEIRGPGQFVNLRLEGFFLRRPISVADLEPGVLTLIVKIAGKGTEQLSKITEGAKIPILTGLGNGYDLACSGEEPLLLGGGAGIPPLYFLAKELLKEGRKVTAVLGFNTASEAFFEEEFRALGCRVILATADGSAGRKGFVTDVLPESYSYVYTCGPLPMLRAVYENIRTGGDFSFEERMGCGFGACMGCSVRTKNGSKRICKEGPVLKKEEIIWEK